MKAGLTATGATILYYIPYNAFIVRADGPTIDRASVLPTVRWTGVFEPAYKLSPRLSDEFAVIAERAMERQRNGDLASNDAVTVVGPGMASKTLSPSASASPLSAGSFSPQADARGTALTSGPQTSLQGGSLVSASTKISLEITAFEPSRVAEVIRSASVVGGTQISYSFGQSGTVRVEVDKAALALLARVPGVMYVDRFVQPYVFNDLARWVVQSGDTQNFATPVHSHGIHGTNQTITLGDTGIDFKHPDFWDPNNATPGPTARKLTAYYKGCSNNCDLTDNGINHGTHTSGSAAGDDGQWHVYNGDATGSNGTKGPHDGQAFDAFLNMQDLSNDGFFVYFDSITALWQMAVNHTSWIHSDSWGSCCGTYIQEAADTDKFIHDNQDFLVVFAAGNSGSSLNTMNPFAVAKNVIAAGATVNGLGLENIADFSSRGPAADGRLKPDIMAPGVQLWSAQGLDPGGDGTQYWQLSGTSMATPTIAGSSALVRQYYMDGWYPTGSKQSVNGFTPSAALIKATMINSGREMTGAGAYGNGETKYPNDNQGWGRLTLDDALFFQNDARGLVVDDHRSGINTNDNVSYDLAIGDSTLPVEITLVWSDYPATANCNPCLVNDLDLTVKAPDGTIYKGNQYSGYNPGESTPNPSGRDSLNNVESVLVISKVQAGLWTVTIHGVNIPQGPQTYALVMTGGIATERGIIGLDHHRYQSSATVQIKVIDTGLNVNPNAPDTVNVNMSSTTESTPEVVTLTETGNSTSVFAGSIKLNNSATPIPGDGLLQVLNGDNITAMYYDNNNGAGGAGPTYANAVVDDTPPVITGVGASNLRFNRATIGWTTDELSDSVVHWGNSTPPGNSESSSSFVLTHAISLSGLTPNTTYFFSVQSTDEAGNTRLDTNGSSYYTFRTLVKPPTAPPDFEWPTFHNNLPRQGTSPSNFLPPLNQVWTDGPHLINRWNGVVMKDGILFSAPLDGVLRARDAFTGEVLWSRSLGGQYYYTSTMTADNGVLYATFYSGAGGYVYALDEFTGNTIWSVGLADTSLDFNARTQMTHAEGLVIGSTWGRQAYALHDNNGSVAWTFQLDALTIASGASINAGVAYFGTVAGTIFALDVGSGTLVWSKTLDGVVTTTPMYAQGNIYAGTYAGTEFALDATTGATVWSTSGFGLIDASAAVYDGINIYFGDFNAEYVALDATDGHVVWRTSTSGPVGTAPALANGFLYGTCWFCPLYVFDTSNGKVVEQHSLASSSGSTEFPAISDGWVWLEDNDGNIYGFFGQLPIGLILSPSRAHQDATPYSKVDYRLNVKNIGVSGADTFDATVILGTHGWAVDLFEADGTTPLPDTNGNGLPDTGSLNTGNSTVVVARITVPGTINPGDQDKSIVTFTSAKDATRSKHAVLDTLVPPPGVTVGPRGYFAPKPGDTVTANMDVRNTGGFNDTINVQATSDQGWTFRLYKADGVTLLADTNGDGIPDVGLVTGLQSVGIVVQVDVPSGVPPDTLQRTVVTGYSTLDPNATGSGTILIELTAPPSDVWPTFHNNIKRYGQSPSPHVPPMTQLWASGSNQEAIWTGPVESDGILYSATLDGFLRARDPWSGNIYWSVKIGDPNYYTDIPVVANGVVYTTGYGLTGGYVYALNTADGSTVWKVGIKETGLDFNARPAMAYSNGMVIGDAWGNFANGQIYALNASDGSLIWTATATGLPFGGPAIGLGMVFQGTTASQVIAVDERSGAIVWTKTLDGTVTSPPLIAQGNLFVGTYSGTMYALDALSGNTMWSTGGFNLIDLSTPAYDGTKLYFGDFNNEYVALNIADGTVAWRTPIGGPVGSSVALANGYVYGTSWDGQFRVLDAKTGTVVDSHPLNAFASTSAPAISRGYVWLEDILGAIYGFGGVGAGQLVGLDVTPASADIAVGKAGIFVATGVDIFGNPVRIGKATWESVNGLGSTLPISGDSAIYIAGVEAGTDTIRATSTGFSGDATVNIMPGALDHVDVMPGVASVAAGEQMTFGAAAKDRFGNTIPGASFTWTVTGGIGSISSTGVFTASTTVGTGTVTAKSGTRTGTSIVEVVPGALAKLEASPSPITVAAGGTMLVNARGFDQYDNEITGLNVLWSATNGGGTSISVTPTGPGSPTAFLTAGFVSGTASLTVASGGKTTPPVAVTVTPGPVARIDVSPSSATVKAGDTLGFSGTLKDIFGNTISGQTVIWDTTLGTISQTGVLTAPTTWTINSGIVTATAGSAHTTVTVTLTAGNPASILAPASLKVAAGSTVTLVATLQDAYGNAIPGSTATLAWTATGGNILPLQDGRVAQYTALTGTGSDTLTVSATGGLSTTIQVTVVAGPPAGIALFGAPSVTASGTLSVTASVTDAYGNPVSGPELTWSTTGGSISTTGVLTAPQTAGTIFVSAATAGRQAFLTVEVTAGALDHLVTAPVNALTVGTGAGVTLTVGGKDVYNNDVAGTVFTWSTSIGSIDVAPGGRTASFFAGDLGGAGTITVSGGGKTTTINVSVSEMSLPIVRQATSPTSLLFLVVALLAIAGSVVLFVRYRTAHRELVALRKERGGPGGPGGM